MKSKDYFKNIRYLDANWSQLGVTAGASALAGASLMSLKNYFKNRKNNCNRIKDLDKRKKCIELELDKQKMIKNRKLKDNN